MSVSEWVFWLRWFCNHQQEGLPSKEQKNTSSFFSINTKLLQEKREKVAFPISISILCRPPSLIDILLYIFSVIKFSRPCVPCMHTICGPPALKPIDLAGSNGPGMADLESWTAWTSQAGELTHSKQENLKKGKRGTKLNLWLIWYFWLVGGVVALDLKGPSKRNHSGGKWSVVVVLYLQ
jgi:hypothetical protein